MTQLAVIVSFSSIVSVVQYFFKLGNQWGNDFRIL